MISARPGATPALRGGGPPIRPFVRVIAVIDGANPSFDYYLAPRLAACGGLDVRTAMLRNGPRQLPAAAFDDALILFCRYATPRWLAELERRQRRIAGVALFLDDDLAALGCDSDVPLLSRLRYWWQGTGHWQRLDRLLGTLLVSTPTLAERYRPARPQVLQPVGELAEPAADRCADRSFVVAYHGSSIHRAEHRWLQAVAARVARQSAGKLRFEVSARGGIARDWRRCPGVHVVPWLPWPEYRMQTAIRHVDLLLSPLLPSPANAARCWTRRIDASRLGAALLVSDESVYRVAPEERVLGMCVPLSPDAWAEAILQHAANPKRCRQLAALNRRWVAGRAMRAPADALCLPDSAAALWRLAPALQP